MLWIKEVEMVDSMEELKSSRSIAEKNLPEFRNAGCETCFCEKVSFGGTESPKRGPVSTRKTDRLHDLRLLSSDWRS